MKRIKLFSFLILSGFISGVFLASAPITASAQENTGGTSSGALVSNESCINYLQAKSNDEITKYAKERFDKRNRALDKLKAKTDSFYKAREDTYNEKLRLTKNIQNRYASDSDISADVKLPKGKKTELQQLIAERKKLIEQRLSDVSKAGDSNGKAQATCAIVFEAKVFQEVAPKVREQMLIDKISMRNALNQARYNTAKAIYESNKDDKDVGTRVKSHKAEISKMNNPESNNAKISAIQAKIESGQSANDDIKALSALVIGAQSKDIAKSLSVVNKSVKEEVKKARAKQKSSSTGGSGGGGSTQGTGGTVAPQSTKPTKKTKKKSSTNNTKRESQKGSECAFSKNGKSNCVVYEPKKKNESIVYVNKRRADAQKEANKQAREEDNREKKAKKEAKENKRINKQGKKFMDKLQGK